MKNSIRYQYLVNLLDKKGQLKRAGGLVPKYRGLETPLGEMQSPLRWVMRAAEPKLSLEGNKRSVTLQSPTKKANAKHLLLWVERIPHHARLMYLVSRVCPSCM